jgi:hypothetical protein
MLLGQEKYWLGCYRLPKCLGSIFPNWIRWVCHKAVEPGSRRLIKVVRILMHLKDGGILDPIEIVAPFYSRALYFSKFQTTNFSCSSQFEEVSPSLLFSLFLSHVAKALRLYEPVYSQPTQKEEGRFG